MTGVLTLEENDSGADYVLDESATSCWITVNSISVYIVRTDEGVSVDLYAKGRENDESLAGTWLLHQEAATEEELNTGFSQPCEHEWHTPSYRGVQIPVSTYCWKCGAEK